MNYKIKIIIILLLINSKIFGFNLFSEESINKEKIEKKQEKENKYVDINEAIKLDKKSNVEIKVEKKKKKSNMDDINIEDFKKDEIIKIKKELPLLRADYLEKQKKIKRYRESLSYIKKVKNIKLEKNQIFKTIYIPVEEVTTIVFDKKIKRIENIKTDRVIIKWNKEDKINNKKIKIINQNPTIKMNLKITFIDEQKLNLEVTTGLAKDKRYIEYRIFTKNNSMEVQEIFTKKLKIKEVYNYFNDLSTKLVLDYILHRNSYPQIIANQKNHNKVLFDGNINMFTIHGKQKYKMKMTLLSSYRSPYFKDNGDKVENLIMLFLNIKNKENDKILILTPELFKKYYSDYTIMYLGNIKNKEHYISPNQSKDIIIVVSNTKKRK